MGQASRIYVSICLLGAFTVVARTNVAAQGTPEKTVVSPAAPQQTPKPFKVSSALMASRQLSTVTPVYPPLAKAARAGYTVLLRVVISKTGSVKDIQFIDAPMMYRDSAKEAVRQWTYRPFVLNGEPVEVETQVALTYRLPPAPR